MTTRNDPSIVKGRASSVAGLGRDEQWLQGWLAQDPSRLGLGPMAIVDRSPIQGKDGNPAFLAADEQRYFSVDVRLGELDASRGFEVLDSWARNRVRHPDRTHVAVLVTETVGERYHTTLEALAEHLPLVVVELKVWSGASEAIIVPGVVLSSAELDIPAMLGDGATDEPEIEPELERSTVAVSDPSGAEDEAMAAGPHAEADEDGDEREDGPGDVTVDDPWKLPASTPVSRSQIGSTQPVEVTGGA